VTNPAAFTGGQDIEDTEHYRQRLLDAYRNPQTGSASDLETWAETVDGVDTATAFTNQDVNGNPAPGQVTVRITGPNGTVPDSTVEAAVLALLQSYDLANVTVNVTTFTPVTLNVTVTLTPNTAEGYDTATLTPNVQTAISNYINSVGAGGTVYLSGIIAAVLSVPGVSDVVVNSPTSNQTTSSSDQFVPGTITVN
jgi:uncharacterized phage protein gp47/JayE